MRKRDLTGETFGKLYVLNEEPQYVSPKGHRKTMWRCLCDCGNICVVMGSHLTTGHSVSCGCQHATTPHKRKPADLTGQRFGMLTVMHRMPNRQVGKNSRVVWHCRCDCGNETNVLALLLFEGLVKSCGCSSVSHSERNMSDYLTTNGFAFKPQYHPEGLYGVGGGYLWFDFAVFRDSQLLFLVELDGEQHRRPVTHFGGVSKYERLKANDALKNSWALQNGILLIRIDVSMCHADSDFIELYDKVFSTYHILD